MVLYPKWTLKGNMLVLSFVVEFGTVSKEIDDVTFTNAIINAFGVDTRQSGVVLTDCEYFHHSRYMQHDFNTSLPDMFRYVADEDGAVHEQACGKYVVKLYPCHNAEWEDAGYEDNSDSWTRMQLRESTLYGMFDSIHDANRWAMQALKLWDNEVEFYSIQKLGSTKRLKSKYESNVEVI